MNFKLIYRSTAAPNITDRDINNILETARKFNSKNNITGCLLYYKNEFLQVLEGDEKTVLELYSHIEKDKRHTDVLLINQEHSKVREFSNWTMAFKELTDLDIAHINEYLDIPKFNKLVDLSFYSTLTNKLFHYFSQTIVFETMFKKHLI